MSATTVNGVLWVLMYPFDSTLVICNRIAQLNAIIAQLNCLITMSKKRLTKLDGL